MSSSSFNWNEGFRSHGGTANHPSHQLSFVLKPMAYGENGFPHFKKAWIEWGYHGKYVPVSTGIEWGYVYVYTYHWVYIYHGI